MSLAFRNNDAKQTFKDKRKISLTYYSADLWKQRLIEISESISQ